MGLNLTSYPLHEISSISSKHTKCFYVRFRKLSFKIILYVESQEKLRTYNMTYYKCRFRESENPYQSKDILDECNSNFVPTTKDAISSLDFVVLKYEGPSHCINFVNQGPVTLHNKFSSTKCKRNIKFENSRKCKMEMRREC